jgi:hypothetical protein
MGIPVKTTIEIADALLDAARTQARERGTTLRAIVEEGLRAVLEKNEDERPFVLRDASVDGSGLQAGIREGAWERIAALIYEGQGG